MLRITIPEREYFDDSKQEFIKQKEQVLNLEHSLISISKWESKWKKPFLDNKGLTYNEFVSYIKCMSLNSNIDEDAYIGVDQETIQKVNAYIDDKMTATWFNEKESGKKKGGRGQVVTSELIYYWMIAYEIPFECQKWHLNRLLTLIRICESKNSPSKKMKKKDTLAQYKALNDARRKALGSRG